ncbi:MAG: polysaccharide biosynthesis protein [Planctomycetaceae bacterium]|nr:polysaccharide biosynthesis protein [Planctomycetaceae bacterium]
MESNQRSDEATSGSRFRYLTHFDAIRSAATRRARGLVREFSTPRSWALAAVHLLVFAGAYWLSYLLKFDFKVSADDLRLFGKSLGWVVGVEFVIFSVLGQFHGWWRYVTFSDLIALLRAAGMALLVLATVNFFGGVPYLMPRTIPLLNCMLVVGILGAMRASWRVFREVFRPMINGKGYRWALMVGTDLSNGILAHQIQSYAELPYRLRGLLGTNGTPVGTHIGQIPILGKVEQVEEIAAAYRVTDILVIAGTLAGPRLRCLMEACHRSGLKLKIIRSFADRLEGDSRVPIRNIQINDLLGRDPVTLDTENIGRLLEGRRVMVTGAGGSIGSEICRQIMNYHPEALILVGRGENRIFVIERELLALHSETALYPCIGDVTNRERMDQIFKKHRPDVVFHAAAHKHVPLMEANVGEAIRNNILGTKCVADLADSYGVLSFVLISTDKAVHPTSVMGATKHVAERYVHTLSQESATRFTVVRFGNVLGSAGSVVPIFQEQVRRGGPITITDPRMTRFFMTIPEASQLVLQAATMGAGGEIFVLEMGEPVRIVDLAHDIIRLSGLPEDSIEITFTGIRPGEKLYEELYFDDEQTLPTSHPKLRAAYHRPYSLAEVRRAIGLLERAVNEPDEALRRKLREIVPEFSPSFNVVERPEAAVGKDRQEVKASA